MSKNVVKSLNKIGNRRKGADPGSLLPNVVQCTVSWPGLAVGWPYLLSDILLSSAVSEGEPCPDKGGHTILPHYHTTPYKAPYCSADKQQPVGRAVLYRNQPEPPSAETVGKYFNKKIIC